MDVARSALIEAHSGGEIVPEGLVLPRDTGDLNKVRLYSDMGEEINEEFKASSVSLISIADVNVGCIALRSSLVLDAFCVLSSDIGVLSNKFLVNNNI